MARRHLFEASSRATAPAALLGFALLTAPLACGSDSASEEGDETATDQTPPSSRRVPPRDEPPAPIEPAPSAEDDDPSLASAAPSESANGAGETPAAPGAGASTPTSVPPEPATTFASCTLTENSYGTNCDYVYVTMTQASPERCVQLTIDNCRDSYGRQGLPVDTPLSWQLSSAAIGSSPDECELGVFNPRSTIVVAASGSIGWDALESMQLPTGIVIDVSLQPSSTARDASSIDVVTNAPLNPARCDD